MADKKKQWLFWLIALGVLAGIVGYKVWYRQCQLREHGGTTLEGKERGGKEHGGARTP